MFFFFSKTFGLLTQPIVIVGVVFLASLLVRSPRRKKMLGWLAFALLMTFSNLFLAASLMRLWEIRPAPFSQYKGPYDYAVLLTGITKGYEGPDGRVYFGRGVDRATHTLHLYRAGLVKKVLISGGSGKLSGGGLLEADELANFFLMAGVGQDDLLLENRSQNTHESAVEVATIFKDSTDSTRLLLVTSGYHLRRAEACFKKAGLQPEIFATEPLVGPNDISLGTLVLPNIEAFTVWQILFKEWTGMVVYWLAGYI